MNDEKKERINNWVRKNFNFSTIVFLLLLLGMLATAIGNVRSIPLLKKDILHNEQEIDKGEKERFNIVKDFALLRNDIQYLREDVAEIKQMMKEDRKNNRRR